MAASFPAGYDGDGGAILPRTGAARQSGSAHRGLAGRRGAPATGPEPGACPDGGLLANYDNIFPILGRKTLEHGVRTPAPLGLNLNYFAVDQGIRISNLGLAVNDGPVVDMSNVITFDETRSEGESINVRPDLWVLPFLNVYGIIGRTWARTSVAIAAPVAFTSSAEMEGMTYGAGLTAAGGLQGFWFAFDTNRAWSDLDILTDLVGTRTFGLRVGKNYRWRAKSVAATPGSTTTSKRRRPNPGRWPWAARSSSAATGSCGPSSTSWATARRS